MALLGPDSSQPGRATLNDCGYSLVSRQASVAQLSKDRLGEVPSASPIFRFMSLRGIELPCIAKAGSHLPVKHVSMLLSASRMQASTFRGSTPSVTQRLCRPGEVGL